MIAPLDRRNGAVDNDLRDRFPLACALVDLYNFPSSARYLRFVATLAMRAGRRLAVDYDTGQRHGPDVDVLSLYTPETEPDDSQGQPQ